MFDSTIDSTKRWIYSLNISKKTFTNYVFEIENVREQRRFDNTLNIAFTTF